MQQIFVYNLNNNYHDIHGLVYVFKIPNNFNICILTVLLHVFDITKY